jgi:hypothetical protein
MFHQGVAVVRPRNKKRGVALKEHVVLSMQVVASFQHLTIREAASKLGVSVTVLKG